MPQVWQFAEQAVVIGEKGETMSDLIERLHDGRGDGYVGGCQGCFQNLMEEAADEIERLNGLVNTWQMHHTNAIEDRDRLRAALTIIAGDHYKDFRTGEKKLTSVAQIASKALNEQKAGGTWEQANVYRGDHDGNEFVGLNQQPKGEPLAGGSPVGVARAAIEAALSTPQAGEVERVERLLEVYTGRNMRDAAIAIVAAISRTQQAPALGEKT